MPITLGSNIASLRGQQSLHRVTDKLRTSYERLSSGQRINRAADDAAGLAIADNLNVDSRVTNQGIRNLNDGLSLLNIADSAIESISGIAIRLQELAEQSANGVYSNKQREALDTEAQELAKEYNRIARTTQFNGRNLFNSDFGNLRLQSGYGISGSIMSNLGGSISDGTFTLTQTYGAGSDARGIAEADFNGDGFLDMVTANDGADTLSVFLGNGDGTFRPRQNFATGDRPTDVATSDFNGDGTIDLVSADYTAGTVSVLLGLGNGTFGSATSYSTGSQTEYVAVGDFNGDGINDLVSSSAGTETIRVTYGFGDGTFGNQISLSPGNDPRGVVVGDFNNDGVADIAAARSSGNVLAVHLGQSGGGFSAVQTYSVGAGANDLASADFNLDGVLDIVTTNHGTNTISVLLGRGDGTFNAKTDYTVGNGPEAVNTGDFNGDGITDLVVASEAVDQLGILLGNGDGTFGASQAITVGNGPYDVAVGDFNEDGVSDLITANHLASNVSVLMGSFFYGLSALTPFSLSNRTNSLEALTYLKDVTERLAKQRGTIGAFQARLDVANNVLAASFENFKGAESRIRDADIAGESAALTQLRILQQSASAILSQANLQPQISLSLLNR